MILSNAKPLFSKMLSPKKHGQVISEKKLLGFSPGFIYWNTDKYYCRYSH